MWRTSSGLPDIGEGVAEGEVVQWFVKEGDVGPGGRTARQSVLTDKANVEIPSPEARADPRSCTPRSGRRSRSAACSSRSM